MNKNIVRYDDPVKGAFYTCGCYCGSDKPVPLFSIPPSCVTHGAKVQRIVLTEEEARRRATIGEVKS